MEFSHIGKGHLDGGKSGRYPFGSGDNPYQRVEGAEKQKYKVVRGYKNFSKPELEKLHEALKREEAKRQLILDIEKLDAKLHNRRLEEKDIGFATAFKKGLGKSLGESAQRGVSKSVESTIQALLTKAMTKVGQKYLIDALDKKLNIPAAKVAKDVSEAAKKK